MNFEILFMMVCAGLGISSVYSWFHQLNPGLSVRIASFIGNDAATDSWDRSFELLSHIKIFEHPRSPWGTDHEITALLPVAGASTSLRSFRIRQLTYVALGLSLVSLWMILKSLSLKPLSPLLGFAMLVMSMGASGWLAKWQLEESRRKRSEHVDAVLPVFLELMAFTVGAGEPVVAAMDRVTKEISGPFADAIKVMTFRIHAGENLADGLRFLNMQFVNTSLSRAVRTLETAIDRGTPLAEVLRGQASDARAAYSRNLMILAGKKETAMLLPVVFLILPMIVAVSIYPGLIALNVL